MKHTHPSSPRRRGAVIAVVVLLLGVVNVTTLAILYGSADDASISVLRVETVRAFYAAESGAIAVAKLRENKAALPAANSQLVLPTATATYEQVPTSVQTTGTLIVRGNSGEAQRRIRLDFEVR